MLLMIEKHHRHPVKSIATRYPTQSPEFKGLQRPATIGIVHCNPAK